MVDSMKIGSQQNILVKHGLTTVKLTCNGTFCWEEMGLEMGSKKDEFIYR